MPVQLNMRRAALAGVTLALLSALPSCSQQDGQDKEDLVFGQKVQGKVSYNGKPVPFGYVLFFHPTKSPDPKSGAMTPVAVGQIQDGRYQADVPTGPMIVCVATDPDVDPMKLLQPALPVGGDARGRPEGGKPGAEGDPGAAPPPPPGGGAPPLPGGGGAPPPPPGGKGGPPPMPGKMFNPAVEKLSAADKAMLREIHSKYGAVGASRIACFIREGEQTFDIILPWQDKK